TVRDACPPVLRDELRVVASPGVRVLGTQMTAVQHVVVVLHERRRAPGTRKEFEPGAAHGHRALDKGNLVAQVGCDGEGGEGGIAFRYVGIARAREVAAVDVGAPESVSD